MMKTLPALACVILLSVATACSSDDATADNAPTPRADSTATSNSGQEAPTISVAPGESAEGQPGCDASNCAFVAVTTSGFAENVTCEVTASDAGTEGFVNWTQGGNERHQSPNYFGGSTITVTCTGGGGSAEGTADTW